MIQTGAERNVVDKFSHRGIVATDRTAGVPANLEFLEVHGERIVHEQPADQRLSLSEDELHDFRRLDQSDRAREHSKNTRLCTRRREFRGWRLRVQTTVARAILIAGIDRNLSLKAEDASIYNWFPGEDTRIVDHISSWEIVAAIYHNVIF